MGTQKAQARTKEKFGSRFSFDDSCFVFQAIIRHQDPPYTITSCKSTLMTSEVSGCKSFVVLRFFVINTVYLDLLFLLVMDLVDIEVVLFLTEIPF